MFLSFFIFLYTNYRKNKSRTICAHDVFFLLVWLKVNVERGSEPRKRTMINNHLPEDLSFFVMFGGTSILISLKYTQKSSCYLYYWLSVRLLRFSSMLSK